LFDPVLASERVFAHTTAMSRTDVRRRQRAVHRRRRLARTVVVAAIAVSGLGFLAGHATAGAEHPSHPRAHRVYVVRGGDTLWSIAGRVAPDADPRAVVDALVRANHLRDAAISPGQTLRVPGSAG
jgi:nucleoid-associated protein YgaU